MSLRLIRSCNLSKSTKGRLSVRQYSTSSTTPSWPMPPAKFTSPCTVIDFPEQKIFIGTDSLTPTINNIKQQLPQAKRILVVSDKGVKDVGLIATVEGALKKAGLEPVVFDSTHPNPTTHDATGIALAFLEGNCSASVAIGGGGPMDAMKAGMAIVANNKRLPNFNVAQSGPEFLVNDLRPLCFKSMDPAFASSVPPMACLPTTAGTGSEGGKSAVITNEKTSTKFVFGNPVFFSKWVALVPQFTEKLPPALTAGTGVDAMFHLMEAYFVTHADALNDGLSPPQIEKCDAFSTDGVTRILEYLPRAFKNGSDMDARLQMQVAAFYGAKAFRKGDLGGVHATGHSIGAKYHLHHGTAIARMAVPVLKFNEVESKKDVATAKKFENLLAIFQKYNFSGATLSEAVHKFLKSVNLPIGIKDLNVSEADLAQLALMASQDPCQTNPVKLDKEKYLSIFKTANSL